MSANLAACLSVAFVMMGSVWGEEQSACSQPEPLALLQVRSHTTRSETLAASGRGTASLLQLAAEEVGLSDVTRNFLRSLRTCSKCKNFKRFGEHNDGGYVMCTDDLDNKHFRGAYSYGINGFDGWGMSMAEQYHVPLFEYDCTNPTEPEACSGCEVKFRSECLAPRGEEKPQYRSLGQQLADSGRGDAPDGSLLLKVDIEGGEWPMFAAESEDLLRKFGQVVVEFHWLNQEANHPQYLAAVQKLLQSGLSIVHVHGNNNGGTDNFGEYSVPDVLEVTFVRRHGRDDKDNECHAHAPEYLQGLDEPNNAMAADLDEPMLPAL